MRAQPMRVIMSYVTREVGQVIGRAEADTTLLEGLAGTAWGSVEIGYYEDVNIFFLGGYMEGGRVVVVVMGFGGGINDVVSIMSVIMCWNLYST